MDGHSLLRVRLEVCATHEFDNGFLDFLFYGRRMDKIKFGTDGWRGVIADDFTFANVRRVAAAVAQYVREESEPARGLVVGYDMRFVSAESALAVAEVLSSAGIRVWLANAGTPTPAVSYAVVAKENFAGAVMVTASHNPYRWNGIKFKAPYGGSADPGNYPSH